MCATFELGGKKVQISLQKITTDVFVCQNSVNIVCVCFLNGAEKIAQIKKMVPKNGTEIAHCNVWSFRSKIA